MDDFLKYFENKDFVQWVLHPNEDLNKHWEKHLRDNPLEKEQINKSRLIILALKSKKILETDNREVALFSGIVRKINTKNKKSPVRRLVFTALKYAAALLLLFSLTVSYYYYQKADQLDNIAKQLTIGVDQNNSQLILADGNKVLIGEKRSEIVYQNNGEIIINKNDTVNFSSKTQIEKYNQLIIPFGKKSSITLPDGTIAHLNAGSRLVYPSSFTGAKREVYLYGEGFFEVFHNEKMPFTVKTNDQEVEVLGTKFNVSAYPSDTMVETVLVEGKVRLKSNDFSFFKDDHILKPDQRAYYDIESQKTSISHVNASKYVSWHLGYLNFETSELNNLVKRLERYYNIKIRLQDVKQGAKTITGKLLLKDDIEIVMNVLATTTSMELTKINESTYALK